MEEMNLFGSVEHNNDNTDKWPDLCDNPTKQDLLDYTALVTARYLNCQKAFKGGYMLNQILGNASRMTQDIDFSIPEVTNYEEVKRVLVRLGDYFVEKGIASSYKIKDTIGERSSGGITVYDSEGKTLVGVDVGLHNISYGIHGHDIKIGNVKAFSIERMLSDKLLAILSRKRFRRTKDLYDFYVITNAFDINLDKLADYIAVRGGAEWDNIPFNDDVIREYAMAWDKLSLASMADEHLDKPNFQEVLERFYAIALPVKAEHGGLIWSHEAKQISRSV